MSIKKESAEKWYRLQDPKSLVEDFDSNKALYRIIPFDGLLQMLNEGMNYLVKIRLWEDMYENFILKEALKCDGKEIGMNSLSEVFYGQCWTSKMSSDAMWRIYSPDKKSVRIKTRLGKLYGTTCSDKGASVVSQVKYYSQAKIEDDIQHLPVLSKGQFISLMIQSLFVKRNSFSHESEYRVIYIANSQVEPVEAPVKAFHINPYDFIENIYFDPRADDAYVERCKRILVNAFHYPVSKIRKSKLYSLTQQPISFVNKFGNTDWDYSIQDYLNHKL